MEIQQLKLFSKDISAQYHFYKNILSFDVDFFGENKIAFQAGNTQLIFEEKPGCNFIYHFAFLIPNQKIEEAILFLEKKGIELLEKDGEQIVYFGTKENYTGRAIYFFDEDGNIAEFIERPTLNHQAQTRFQLNQIIKINEIGIPVDVPLSFSNKLIKDYKIQVVDNGIMREDFCWVGDYDGVFIVVKNGRHWLPTELPARSNDCWVKFESQGNIYEMEFKDGNVI